MAAHRLLKEAHEDTINQLMDKKSTINPQIVTKTDTEVNMRCDCSCHHDEKKMSARLDPPCPDGLVTCTSETKCIPQQNRCDNNRDCKGGEDETGGCIQ